MVATDKILRLKILGPRGVFRSGIYGLRFILYVLAFLNLGCYREKTFPVKASFSIEVIGNNYSVPVKVKVTNNTTGAETYDWTLEGAGPASSTERDIGTIEYDSPGSYKIKLVAANHYGGMDSMETTLLLDADIHIGFAVSNKQSYFPDATVQINNTTTGATSYQWTFVGGTPVSSTSQQPGNVVFGVPGPHNISLKVGNGRIGFTKDTTINVLPDLVNVFAITWAALDNDMEVPFTATMVNNCISATVYKWSFGGGTPTSSTNSTPSVAYNTAGTYTITLSAGNDKKSLQSSKTVTLLPNSNLFKFANVKLGINTAQNSIGSYFSSVLGKVLKSNEVTAANGGQIDFAYFGLDNSFSYNKILSPDSVQNYTFSAIPNATRLNVINRLESCGCGTNMTAGQFDAMTDDALLQATSINQTPAGLGQFDNTLLPRVVLFMASNGRKGAIKIKQFVDAGQQSYMVCDVKVMKQ